MPGLVWCGATSLHPEAGKRWDTLSMPQHLAESIRAKQNKVRTIGNITLKVELLLGVPFKVSQVCAFSERPV